MSGRCSHVARAPWLASGLSVAWALIGCAPSGGEAWMPLDAGRRHVYAVRTETGDGAPREEVWIQTVTHQTEWEGRTVSVRHHSAGVEFYLAETPQGIQRVAVRAEVDAEPQADDPPRWVLKAPYAIGVEWTTPTVPYLLQRRNEHPRELRHTHRLSMQWRIVSLDDEVTTEAGRFRPCLRVEGVGSLNLYTDPVNGFTDVPVTGKEWYCRGVGLVKWERRETVPPGFFVGGVVTAELTR